MNDQHDAAVEWRNDLDSETWDRFLAALGGHPLQSALWGDARKAADGIDDQRWIAFIGGEPVWMARIEKRHVPVLGWVGWVPRGPAGSHRLGTDFASHLCERLSNFGMMLLITDRWQPSERNILTEVARLPRTIWIDLSAGLPEVSRNLDKQWRYGVGRARRQGVTVDASIGSSDIEDFFGLCRTISEMKKFELPESSAILNHLLSQSQSGVEARLFIARLDGRIGAGAFVIRCGRSMHYFWGATDRDAAQARAGEAVQWAAVEWGVAQGCTLYDLEGIDPVSNPGTYAFKKKMGGSEVTLRGKEFFPTKFPGRILAGLYEAFDRRRAISF